MSEFTPKMFYRVCSDKKMLFFLLFSENKLAYHHSKQGTETEEVGYSLSSPFSYKVSLVNMYWEVISTESSPSVGVL